MLQHAVTSTVYLIKRVHPLAAEIASSFYKTWLYIYFFKLSLREFCITPEPVSVDTFTFKQLVTLSWVIESNWLVISSSEQLVLGHDGAVDGGVGALCRGLDHKTKGFDEAHKRSHEVPRYFSVHRARVHSVGHHAQNCRWRDAVRFRAFSQTGSSHFLKTRWLSVIILLFCSPWYS